MKALSIKKFTFALLAFFTLACFSSAVNTEVPTLTGRVVDTAHMISESGKAKIADDIKKLEDVTAGQMAVLTMPSLNGDALEDFSMRVAETWKIGRKGQDNGIILLLVKDSHQIRLEVGYGWESIINDARAGDIIREMAGYFKKGQFDDGISFAIQKITKLVSAKVIEKQPAGTASEKGSLLDIFKNFFCDLIVGLAAFVCFLMIFCIPIFFGWGIPGNTYGGGSGSRSGGSGSSGGGGSFGGGGASGRW